jgi:hypothetical protein
VEADTTRGRSAPGGSGGGDAPDVDFRNIVARLTRHFHQTPDYWWDNCTITDWIEIWQHELIQHPPVEVFAASYFRYDPNAKEVDTNKVPEEATLPEYED